MKLASLTAALLLQATAALADGAEVFATHFALAGLGHAHTSPVNLLSNIDISASRKQNLESMNDITDLSRHTFQDTAANIRSSWFSFASSRHSASLPESPQKQHLRHRSMRRRSQTQTSCGRVVEPGRVINRSERRRRQLAQSLSPTIPARETSDYSFACLGRKIKQAAQPLMKEIDNELRIHLAPEAAAAAHLGIQHAGLDKPLRCFPLRQLILTAIFFLLTFSSLHVVVSHLLSLSRVSAQCSPLVNYVPVTYTVTSYVTPSVNPPPTTTVLSTSTWTHTLTVVLSQVSIAPASLPTSNGNTYYYIIESGTTSWFNSIAPSTGQRLITVTSTVYVQPSSVAPTSILDPVTVSPPAYVSTTYSDPDPDVTITKTTTRTLTTTIPNIITRTRSSFTGIGSAGWNSTTDVTADGTGYSASTVSGVPTTITGTIYWSTGNKITSTSFTTLTTTVTQSRKSTVTTTADVSTSTGNVVPSPSTTGQISASPSYVVSADSSITGSPSSSTILFGQITTAHPLSYSILPASYDEPSVYSSSSVAGQLSSSTVVFDPQTISSSTTQAQGSSLVAGSTRKPSSASTGPALVSSRTASSGSPVSTATLSLPGISTTSSLSALSSQSSYSTPSLSTLSSSAIISPSNTSGTQTSLPSASLRTSSKQVSVSISTGRSSSSVAILLSSSTSLTRSSGSSIADPLATSAAGSSRLLTSSASSSQASIASSALSTVSSSAFSTSGSKTSSLQASSVISTSASATPSVCGEHGNFTLTFDDLPSFSTNNNNTDITQGPPIFSGYHHFAFSNGYIYAPPPSDPFPPRSPPHLAVFLGNASGNGTANTPTAMAPTAGMIRPGEFGNGDVDYVPAFWFNAYNAWMGCDNPGPEPCTYVLTAYAWNAAAQQEQQLATQNVTTSGCPGFQNCQLQQINFPSAFQGLSGLQIQAYRGPDQVMFFMDDVSMGWYNNTCAAGLQRLRSQRGGTPFKR